MSHLRAFYTQLFRNIADGDLKDEKGQYFHAANDVAILFPIVEQSGTNIKYVPELTYVYNSNTGLNNHQIRTREQKNNQIIIRKKGIYLPLEALIFDPV